MIILSVSAILLLIVLFIPIRAVVGYDEKIYFYIKILFFRFTPSKKRDKKSDFKNGSEKAKNSKIELIKKILKLSDELKSFVSYVSEKCIVVEHIKLSTEFGTGDAASCGILTGAVNALVYSLLAIIHHNTILKKHSIQISPDFSAEKFSVNFLCIVKTRPVHIISTGIKAIKLYKLFKSL